MQRLALYGGLLYDDGLASDSIDEQLRAAVAQWRDNGWSGRELVESKALAVVIYRGILRIGRIYFDGDAHIMCSAIFLLRRYVSTANWRSREPLDEVRIVDDDDETLSSAPLVFSPETSVDETLRDAAIVCLRLAANAHGALEHRRASKNLYRDASPVDDDDRQSNPLLATVSVGRLHAREVHVVRALDYRLALPSMYEFYAFLDAGAWPASLVQSRTIDTRLLARWRASVDMLLLVASTRVRAPAEPWYDAAAVFALLTDIVFDRVQALSSVRRHVVPRLRAAGVECVDIVVFSYADELLTDIVDLYRRRRRAFTLDLLTDDGRRSVADASALVKYARSAPHFVSDSTTPLSPERFMKRRRIVANYRLARDVAPDAGAR